MDNNIKEDRIRAITKLYYLNPKIQNALISFGENREVVPRYFEGFGKRPDILQYPSDVTGLVMKGATSFHCSEELWEDPLKLNSDMTQDEMKSLRKSWDLLIDVDSKFLDYSKIASELIIAYLERCGIYEYGIKFSGSKGFHIILSGKAFPEIYDGKNMREMFPDWPRAIAEFLIEEIRGPYSKKAGEIIGNIEDMSERINVKKEDLIKTYCKECGFPAEKGEIVKFKCPVCSLEIERKNIKITKRRLTCLNNSCAGVLEVVDKKDYFFCTKCKESNSQIPLSSDRNPDSFDEQRLNAEKIASPDLVLVAPRHLFRMPYSLHEKTSLASVVLTKEELKLFNPKMANPFQVSIREFIKETKSGVGERLLRTALEWKSKKIEPEMKIAIPKNQKKYDKFDFKNITDGVFPIPIKKLLKGLVDGKKRGAFILITFFKTLNFAPEEITRRVMEWNKLNQPPLKEGYLKSQLEWHFRQNKVILPPNYENDSFYKDLGLLDKKQLNKNPIVDVMKALIAQRR